jgi:predicted MFS family arabinose efflux permease
MEVTTDQKTTQPMAAWSAVFALTLCASMLVASEWMPVRLQGLPDDAEAGGGLMVAVVQLAITTGAAGGGLLFDSRGYQATFLFGAVILGLSSLVILVGALRRHSCSRRPLRIA